MGYSFALFFLNPLRSHARLIFSPILKSECEVLLAVKTVCQFYKRRKTMALTQEAVVDKSQFKAHTNTVQEQ